MPHWTPQKQQWVGTSRSPAGDTLEADPHLPVSWRAVELRLRYRGRRVRVRATADGVELELDD